MFFRSYDMVRRDCATEVDLMSGNRKDEKRIMSNRAKSIADEDTGRNGAGLCFLTTIVLIVLVVALTILGYLDSREMAIISGTLAVLLPLIWFFGLSTVWWIIRKMTGIADYE